MLLWLHFYFLFKAPHARAQQKAGKPPKPPSPRAVREENENWKPEVNSLVRSGGPRSTWIFLDFEILCFSK